MVVFNTYFIFEFLEKNRAAFKGMTFKKFAENYEVPNSLSEEFIVYSKFNEAQIDLTNYDHDLKKALKANIAQQLFGPNAYETILNEGDLMLSKVIELDAKSSN